MEDCLTLGVDDIQEINKSRKRKCNIMALRLLGNIKIHRQIIQIIQTFGHFTIFDDDETIIEECHCGLNRMVAYWRLV